MLYWSIGKRIQSAVLGGERAENGKQVLAGLSKELTREYGKGWGEKQLRHCLRAAEILSEEIVYTACRQLSWSHLRLIFYMEDDLKRSFYLEMASLEGWSVRQLSERIQSMLYERTAISRQPAETIAKDLAQLRQQQFSPELVLKDLYFLDFLGLTDHYVEKDLEDAILRDLEQFLISPAGSLLRTSIGKSCSGMCARWLARWPGTSFGSGGEWPPALVRSVAGR